MLSMRKATLEERQQYYKEEWDRGDLPSFVLHTLSMREFGFDHDGNGPKDRYNQFMTPEQLSDFLRRRTPYAAYGSVALYEVPTERKRWLKSELVFDVDAKDLPIKSCDCADGAVCDTCLDEARLVAASFGETLRSDLAIQDIHYVYSGRGFHIRINDESVMGMESNERNGIVEYITGGAIPTDMTMALGYSKIFRDRASRMFERMDERHLSDARVRGALARKLVAEKEKVLASLRRGHPEEISNMKGVGAKSLSRLLQHLARLNAQMTDGKVTIDIKRIIRLPSSLHSGVSRKCMAIPDIDKFSPDDAVPKFIREGGN